MQKESRLWTKDFILTCLATLIINVSFHMLFPVLPVYAEEIGGSKAVAGVIVGVFAISALLIRPFAGRLIDNRGRQRVLQTGFLFFVLSVFLYNYSTSVLSLLLIRILHGVGFGILTTGLGTVAADLVPPASRGEGLGYFGLTNIMPIAFAAPMGIVIKENYGFFTLFMVSFIIACIAFFLTFLIRYPAISRKADEQKKWVVFEARALRPSLIVLFMNVMFGGIITFIVLFSESIGLSRSGWYFTIYATVVIFVRPLAGRLADRKGSDTLVIPGILMLTGGVLLLGGARSHAPFFISAGLVGLGLGIAQPCLLALAMKMAPEEHRGAANATFLSALDIGVGGGAMVLGAVAAGAGYADMYLYSSAAGFLAIILYWLLLYGAKGGRVPTSSIARRPG